MGQRHNTQVLILGGGVAGLSIALRLVASGQKVTLLAKRTLTEGSSRYAQGGIAAVTDAADSVESHIEDTLQSGAGLCQEAAVRFVAENAKSSIEWLLDQGVDFTRDDSDQRLHLTQEGGHSQRRVVHASDATGAEVMRVLEEKAYASPDIEIIDQSIAIDLITSAKLDISGPNQVLGVYALNKDSGRVDTFIAPKVVLATGGASKVYLYTSNPDTSTGDGVAMAWRAGCRVANMEFVQFHPTCLYHPQAKSFLVSEAVRGEGGKLVLPNGEQFMQEHDKRVELAPRDIVARAIDYEMKRGGFDSVFLDISHKPADFILEHFPNISKRCEQFGFDMTKQALPVVPAAHYTCGGVIADLDACTDIAGLYAVGECASTGLHGANRLASNSLLECLVMGASASEHILANSGANDEHCGLTAAEVPGWDETQVTDPDEQIVVTHNWDELRRAMWDYVGIVRTDKRLERAQHRVRLLQEEIRDYYSNFRVDNNLVELRNLVTVADLIISSALMRKESRGLHYTLDYPESFVKDEISDTVMVPPNYSASATEDG
ncbi:MAG: L-aspartate oxidase [Gammaproteobacteria bacterium]|nr:L-aspartate oxidase [Gammaproteobacteria bacterium]MCP4089408.1 L-aspartate oxidase [Gammaproteobacteria bacterium]MCP4277523.1 L-aspartate oxidase [Gammaproteobacteria bacterium]MCP4831131.1 L-aspartate oxidase [Gammaproteobacteria bacterium]MCP4928554.1 L-aspartate oxidase [Gammaproteobacteria bacterium]